MEAANQAGQAAPAQRRREDDWTNDEFVENWIVGQANRQDERRRQFFLIRALIPKLPDEEFRYLNIGAGPGHLDEVLLERFNGAQATLLDCSMVMLDEARQRL